MEQELGVLLLESDMYEIERIIEKIQKKINKNES